MITTEGQKKIIAAFFEVAATVGDTDKITIKMIADQVGIRRESIYKYHFRNIDEIINHIHNLIDKEVFERFKYHTIDKGGDAVWFLTYEFLPVLYEKREWLKILYSTKVDPSWMEFLVNRYVPIIKEYLDLNNKNEPIHNLYLSKIVVKEFLSIVSTWLTHDEPESLASFQKKFLYLLKLSPYSILSQEISEG